MLRARFYSDCNRDGFVQSIAQRGLECVVDWENGWVLVEMDEDEFLSLVSTWDGDVL